ncbi:MAG: ankyrin repeat domain-containing protein [Candidatus Aminicenantes bacterium]|jgi:ankyrin repeat protein
MQKRKFSNTGAIFITLFLFLAWFTCCKSENDKQDSLRQGRPQSKSEKSPSAELSAVLRDAAARGQIQEVRAVLEKGADVNTADELGRTALMLGAFDGHTEIVRLLLSKGAQVDLRDSSGRTALMYSSSGPFPETVQLLLDWKADPNLVDGIERWTALMFAAGEGQLEVVKILLEHNADPSLKDVDGDTALTFAQRNGHAQVVRLLK